MPPPDIEDELRSLITAIGAQTQAIGALAQAIGSTHVDHEQRLRVLETIAIQLKERMSIWQLAQAGYTTVASAIAGAIAFMRR